MQNDFPLESIGALRNLARRVPVLRRRRRQDDPRALRRREARLVLARMLLDPPNFLVLDEPTNHLDLATKEMLVEALHDYEGTMLFVSHDRMFLRGLANRVLELPRSAARAPRMYGGATTSTCATGHEAPGMHA